MAISALVFWGCTKNISQSRAINPTRVAIVYTADNANSITGAATASIKYPHCTVINIDNMTTANQLTAIQTITDSVHRVLLMVDTATVWATNKLTGAQYDSLAARLYTDTAYSTAPDAAVTYYQASATKNLAEVVWDALYPTLTEPLVVEYLGDDIFSTKLTRSKKVNTDSTVVDSTGSLTADAYIGDWLVIYSGTGMGQARQIYDNSTTVYYVSPDWDTNPDHTSLMKVKKEGEDRENFFDMYTNDYILPFLSDLSSNTVMTNWHKLIDAKNNINTNVTRAPYQDLNYLNNTVLFGGKIIWDYRVNVLDY